MKIEGIEEIAKQFQDRFERLKELPVPTDMDTTGTPFFTEEDISRSKNDKDAILRTLFVKHRITRTYFSRQFKKYASSVAKIPERSINSQMENYIRIIKKGGISPGRLENALMIVLGLRMKQILAKFIDASGKEINVEVENPKMKVGQDEDLLRDENQS